MKNQLRTSVGHIVQVEAHTRERAGPGVFWVGHSVPDFVSRERVHKRGLRKNKPRVEERRGRVSVELEAWWWWTEQATCRSLGKWTTWMKSPARWSSRRLHSALARRGSSTTQASRRGFSTKELAGRPLTLATKSLVLSLHYSLPICLSFFPFPAMFSCTGKVFAMALFKMVFIGFSSLRGYFAWWGHFRFHQR